MNLKKEQPNDLVIGYWKLKFFSAIKGLSHKGYNRWIQLITLTKI